MQSIERQTYVEYLIRTNARQLFNATLPHDYSEYHLSQHIAPDNLSGGAVIPLITAMNIGRRDPAITRTRTFKDELQSFMFTDYSVDSIHAALTHEHTDLGSYLPQVKPCWNKMDIQGG